MLHAALLGAGVGAAGGLSPDPLLSLPWSQSTSHAATMATSPPAFAQQHTLSGLSRMAGSSGQRLLAGPTHGSSGGTLQALLGPSQHCGSSAAQGTAPAWDAAGHSLQGPSSGTGFMAGLHAEDSESDLLPFVLDSDGLLTGSPKVQYGFTVRASPGPRMQAGSAAALLGGRTPQAGAEGVAVAVACAGAGEAASADAGGMGSAGEAGADGMAACRANNGGGGGVLLLSECNLARAYGCMHACRNMCTMIAALIRDC